MKVWTSSMPLAGLLIFALAPEAGICQRPPVLPVQAKGVHVQRRAGMIASVGTVVKGAEFQTRCPAVWKALPNGEQHVPLTLAFTNRGAHPLCFSLFDTVRVELQDADGKPLPIGGGRNRTRPGTVVSAPLAASQTYLLTRSVRLRSAGADRFSLQGDDGFGGNWTLTDLKSGKYRLILHYEHTRADTPDARVCWQGTAQTHRLTFEIR